MPLISLGFPTYCFAVLYIDLNGADAISPVADTQVFNACVVFGATSDIAFPVFCIPVFMYGDATVPHLLSQQRIAGATACSPNQRACSCTCSLPHKNLAVHCPMSHDFLPIYQNAFCAVSVPESHPNTVLAIGVAPVATQNPVLRVPLPI